MSQEAIGIHAAWDVSDIDVAGELQRLDRMAESLVVRHLKGLMETLPPGPASIEIGSGLGKLSWFSTVLGADATLLDSSAAALASAQRLYAACDLPVSTQNADALALPDALKGDFDLSMSLGVNEHFSGGARQAIFDAHFEVLRSGGAAFICVPNRHCLSYRTAMLMWRLTGRWPKGLYEYGFSIAELRRRMRQAGFADIEVFSGTRPIDDFSYFVLGNLRAAFRKFGLSRPPSPEIGAVRPQATCAAIREKARALPLLDRFCHRQSYTLIATGVRR